MTNDVTERNRENEIISLLNISFRRICGGGIIFRQYNNCSCHRSLPTFLHHLVIQEKSSLSTQEDIEAHPNHHTNNVTSVTNPIIAKNETTEKLWYDELENLLMKSISFFKNKSDSNTLEDDIGKANDVEIRIATTFFHKYRHKCTNYINKIHEEDCNKMVNDTDKRRKICKRNMQTRLRGVELTTTNTDNGFDKLVASTIRHQQRGIEVISDLGLVRIIESPLELAHLLVNHIEDTLWASRTKENNADNYYEDTIPDGPLYIVSSNMSGIITIVTPERNLYLQRVGRISCPYCVRWCKGEKGLWWHQQQEHGIDYSESTAMASISSVSANNKNNYSLVIYQGTSDNSGHKKLSNLTDMKSKNQHSNPINPCDEYFNLIKEGNVHKLKAFLHSHNEFDPTIYTDKNGALAIHWAAGSGNISMVKYLIEKLLCSPNEPQKGKRSYSGRTPLHWSARNGHLNVVKYLVEVCNVELNAVTVDGTSAFCWAAWQGHGDVMRYLHSKNADVSMKNSFGCNAILWSAQSNTEGSLETIAWLLSVGCDAKLVNHNGHSIVHKAAQRGKVDVCQWFFDNFECLFHEASQRDVNITDSSCNMLNLVSPDMDYCCPSDLAGMEGHFELARWLEIKEHDLAYEYYKISQIRRCRIPSWLADGLVNAKYHSNRYGIEKLWERGAGVRKIAAYIYRQVENEDRQQ